VATCLALLGQSTAIPDPTALAKTLRSRARLDVVTNLRGRPVASEWRRVAGRLRGRVSDAGYHLLLDLLDERQALAGLLSGPISERRLVALASLPIAFRRYGVERLVAGDGPRQTFEFAVAALANLRPDLTPALLARSLRNVRSGEGLEEWLCQLLERAPLPTPPWPGTDTLCPLLTTRAYRDAGRRFRNCLPNYLIDVVAGHVCFYEWRGGRPAISCLRHHPLVGWFVEDVKAPRNRRPDPDTKAAVLECFRTHGFRQLQPPLRMVL
jgi:hypothetical protein